ncbi:MAG: hypothetical protein KJ587_08055 [Alphaproteobacteria bacterium]|nr:hypothetical protein [Alphaproteobacteria bacterium]
MTNQAAKSDTVKTRETGETLASMATRLSTERKSSSEDTVSSTAEELARTVEDLKEMVARRTERAASYAHEVAGQHPWFTVTLAGALGAIVAISIAPRKHTRNRRNDWQDYLPSTRTVAPYMPTELPSRKSMLSRFEGLVDSISELDPKAVGIPAIKTVQDLYGSVRDAFQSDWSRNERHRNDD